jgi:hypothetical protein
VIVLHQRRPRSSTATSPGNQAIGLGHLGTYLRDRSSREAMSPFERAHIALTSHISDIPVAADCVCSRSAGISRCSQAPQTSRGRRGRPLSRAPPPTGHASPRRSSGPCPLARCADAGQAWLSGAPGRAGRRAGEQPLTGHNGRWPLARPEAHWAGDAGPLAGRCTSPALLWTRTAASGPRSPGPLTCIGASRRAIPRDVLQPLVRICRIRLRTERETAAREVISSRAKQKRPPYMRRGVVSR